MVSGTTGIGRLLFNTPRSLRETDNTLPAYRAIFGPSASFKDAKGGRPYRVRLQAYQSVPTDVIRLQKHVSRDSVHITYMPWLIFCVFYLAFFHALFQYDMQYAVPIS
jgi:hypothetical protein